MGINENFAERVRRKLANLPQVEEKFMFGGLAFMVDDKLCIGVKKDEILIRINPAHVEQVIENNACRQMIHGKKTMPSYLFVEIAAIQNGSDFNYWIDLALAFNPFAKSSKSK